MTTEVRKQLAVRVDQETHKKLKILAVEKGITIQEYLLNLITQDLNKNKPKE